MSIGKLCCLKCKKNKVKSNFYITDNILFSSGRFEVCKQCINEIIEEKGINGVKLILRTMNKPFDEKLYYETVKEHFGNYMRQINSLPQHKGATWDDGILKSKTFKQINDRLVYQDDLVLTEDVNLENKDEEEDELVITKDIIVKFGKGYSFDEYLQMEKFYQDMTAARDISTPEHKKLLVYMCKIQLEMDKALTNQNINTFEKLHKQYQELIKNSGFRPIDKTAADKTSGVRTFAQVFSEIEKDGFIKPVPIKENQDIVDKTIQYILNYQLRLLNMQVLTEPPEDTPKVDDIDG